MRFIQQAFSSHVSLRQTSAVGHAKYNWGKSAVLWSGGSRLKYQVLVPSSLEVLQIFEISLLGNQSEHNLTDAVANWAS